MLKFFGIHVKHRGETHFLIIPLSIIIISFVIDFNNFLFWFGMGYLSHWIADSLTISGVPISPLDKNKFTLFGGKIKTGEPLEFILAFGLLAISLLIAKPSVDFFIRDQPSYFNVFYMNYKELNEKKIIDNKEYLEKRFKFF
ncbi:hypothetical protein FNB60_09015 [Campylobacter coli]|nr:hypothetical protein [Campylobacter coli]